jgi:hypothetical protein
MQRLISSNDEVPAPWTLRLRNIIAGPLFPRDREHGPRFSSSVNIRTRRDIRHSVHVIETREDWFKIQDSFLADVREVPLLSVDVESHLTPRGKTGQSNISLADSTVLDYYDKTAEFRPSFPGSYADLLADSHADAPKIVKQYNALVRLPMVVIEPIYPRSVSSPSWGGASSSGRKHSVRSLSGGGPECESFSKDQFVLP